MARKSSVLLGNESLAGQERVYRFKCAPSSVRHASSLRANSVCLILQEHTRALLNTRLSLLTAWLASSHRSNMALAVSPLLHHSHEGKRPHILAREKPQYEIDSTCVWVRRAMAKEARKEIGFALKRRSISSAHSRAIKSADSAIPPK